MGDTYLKDRAERQLKTGEKLQICDGKVLLHKFHNRGAMLGLGKLHGAVVTALSVGLTMAASLLFILSLSVYGSNLLRTGLSLLLGGAFSNTYDRLKQQYVTDYFSFNVKWGPLSRLIFNVSDFCIILGSMLSVLGLTEQKRKLRKRRQRRSGRHGEQKAKNRQR